ncbi:MAG: hypothetical protein L3K19_05695 [Thermoplasmata archaeon]|nr:hypothetical protein [Thermoplasmata archaeon]
MATPPQSNPVKDGLYSRLNSIESNLSEASRLLNEAQSALNSLDAAIGGLAGRLSTIRGRGYAAMGHLDKTVKLLSDKWAEVGSGVRQSLANTAVPLNGQINTAQGEARTLRELIDMDNFPAAEGLAARLSSTSESLKMNASREAAQATAPVRDLNTALGAVDRDLKVAETTVELFGQASFPLQQQESPVLAIEGKVMEGEKSHGTLYFTNHRFVFEGQKEVVLEKHLFIVTKKRIERVVMIERPVGAVHQISKGRVGLLAGIGVFVEFKPEVGLPVSSFDVKRWEADVTTRFFRYITGGEADRDIAATHGVTNPVAPTIKLARCPACGAPHSGEIYQGQTSVQCEYCGAAVAIT